jgi:hypothetical protein
LKLLQARVVGRFVVQACQQLGGDLGTFAAGRRAIVLPADTPGRVNAAPGL